MLPLTLKIIADNSQLWNDHPTYNKARNNEDCGLDIPLSESHKIPADSIAYTVDLGFKAEQNYGYMLVPRSSISKTPLRLANSVGIIDKSYRGKVIVKLDNISNKDFQLKKGSCYFQIIAFNGMLPRFSLVNEINDTERGEGSFGSTTN